MKTGLLAAYGISTDYTGGMKMKKVWYVLSVSVLLIALILGGALSAAASSETTVTWTVDGNKLTISGAGAMSDYNNNAPWLEYKDRITSIEIGKGVTSIGSNAFLGFSALETVTLEQDSQLNAIGAGAFYGCEQLKSIAIPAGVSVIGNWAFFGCAGLENINFCGIQAEWNRIEKGDSWNAGVGEYTVNYLHESDDGRWECVDENGHMLQCEGCGTTMVEVHHWAVKEIVSATHTEFGEITYECLGCRTTKEEAIDKVSECTYNIFEIVEGDETNHKKVCACGEEREERHNWKTLKMVPATHTKTGSRTELCAGCGMTRVTSIPKIEAHNYILISDVKATHVDFGLRTYACDCGETRVELVDKIPDHSYRAWTAYGDAVQHKKVCACGDEIYESHNWGVGKVTKLPSHMEFGEIVYTCADCRQTKTESIAKLPTHEYVEWIECEEDDTQHTAICVCGYVKVEGHLRNNGEVITPHTHVSTGVMKYTCKCGHEMTETIPAGHTYGEWENHDARQHKAECSCGHEIYADHIWDEGRITKVATHTTYGEKTYTCFDCQTTKTERIDKTVAHTFSDSWVNHDAAQHKKVCACGEAQYAEHNYGDWIGHDDDMHKKACACGSEIYGVHKWEITTIEPTHTKEGQKTYTCSDCGHKIVQTIDKLSGHTYGEVWTKHDDEQHKKSCACGDVTYESHSWNEGEIISEATKQEEGKMKYVCTVCGCEKTEAIPKLDAVVGGCGATVAGGAALMLLLSIGSAALVYKKKED